MIDVPTPEISDERPRMAPRSAPSRENPWLGRVVVVTGAASGLGRAFCTELAARGAQVVGADVQEQGLETLLAETVARGGSLEVARTDVTREDEVRRLVHDVARRHGALDYLFNNAGITVAGEVRELSMAHWRRVLEVNLFGVLHGVAAAYPLMIEQGSGHIVNTASLAGLVPYPTNAPYATAKHGVVGLSQSLRAEARDLGVRVTALCPAYIESGIYTNCEFVAGIEAEAMRRRIKVPIMPTGPAVRALLRGVERNQALVVYPGYARVMHFLFRLWAPLLDPFGRDVVAGYREEAARRRAEG